MKTIAHSSLLTVLVLASACVDEATDPGALEFRTTTVGCGSDCPVGNSPRVNDYEVPELNLDGLANAEGVALLGILDPFNNYYSLDVVDDEFVAEDTMGNFVATGDDLVSWRIWLELPGGVEHHVKIKGYDRIASWATNGDFVGVYALAYQVDELENYVNVCPESGEDAEDLSVTLILGETYDRELIRVNSNKPRWFTLACRNEATYKMKMMNYGPNEHFNGTNLPATASQRQATLKMITADYCGTGVPYTTQGTPVFWKNTSNTVNNYQNTNPLPTIEARWNYRGAICLDDPRRVSPGAVDCTIPACPGNAQLVSEWRTWTPPAP